MPDKVLYYHTAPWCAPCRAMKPKARQLASQYGYEFIEINIDTQMPAAADILTVPTVIAFENGVATARLDGGMVTPANLRKALA